ncbi:hypothetical protein BDR04DRAFT_589821 [Suillus decipiens]|nr:hypothetical protein BDR04DRAFT_589821 [Suillus decipiens]
MLLGWLPCLVTCLVHVPFPISSSWSDNVVFSVILAREFGPTIVNRISNWSGESGMLGPQRSRYSCSSTKAMAEFSNTWPPAKLDFQVENQIVVSSREDALERPSQINPPVTKNVRMSDSADELSL